MAEITSQEGRVRTANYLKHNLKLASAQAWWLTENLLSDEVPRLKVSWRLVEEMLQAIGWEMRDRLPPNDVAVSLPYLGALTEMFSNEVFQSV